MGIKGSVLNYYVFGNTNAERSEIPDSPNAAIHHVIRYFLSNLDRNCQHTDIDVIFKHLLLEFIRMEDGNTAQGSTYQFRFHIECGNNFQPEMVQARVAQQSCSQTSHTEKKCFMNIGKSKKVFQ